MSGSSGSAPVGEVNKPPQADEALTLAVHTMPGAAAVAANEAAARTRAGRIRMLLVLLVCAAPVVASYVSYFLWRPAATRSWGELIQPTRGIPAATGQDLSGQSVPLAALRGQWLIVVVSGGDCSAPCERNLFLQRQLREALGRDKDRVDRVWIVADAAPVRPQLLPALETATVLRVDPAVVDRWFAPHAGHKLEEHLYVVDPMGEWMLRFPPGMSDADATRARRDLERLLRASASWDRAGR